MTRLLFRPSTLSLIIARSESLRCFDDAIGFAYCHAVYANATAKKEARRGFRGFFLGDEARDKGDRFLMFLPITKISSGCLGIKGMTIIGRYFDAKRGISSLTRETIIGERFH